MTRLLAAAAAAVASLAACAPPVPVCWSGYAEAEARLDAARRGSGPVSRST